jgi:hypothetical protein
VNKFGSGIEFLIGSRSEVLAMQSGTQIALISISALHDQFQNFSSTDADVMHEYRTHIQLAAGFVLPDWRA